MRVSVLLADKGTINPHAGTLNLLNVGWSQAPLRPAPAPLQVPGGFLTLPTAIAVFFEVEYQHCNHPIALVLTLLNEDGRPVELPGPQGPQQVQLTQMVTVVSPAGAPYGTPGSGNALVDISPGLPLAVGGYRWNVTLDGEHEDPWFAAFRVMAAPQAPVVTFGADPPAS